MSALQKLFFGLACTIVWCAYVFWPTAVMSSEVLSIRTVGDPADEIAEQNVINGAVKSAIARNDVVALTQMSNRFRRDRARTASGVWELSVFYSRVLAELGPREGQCDDRQAQFFRNWVIKTPNDPAPYVARAANLEAQAWCIRGGGYAQSVSAPSLASFTAKVREAQTILDEHRVKASIDPHYYAVMARIYIDRGADKAKFKQLLDQATAREANYHYLYYEAYRYFQPQWYGSAAEIEELARYAAARTTSDDRAGMYARFYWFVLDCDCGDMDQSIDWPTMKQSMHDVMARYPSAWNAANFARISCAMNDAEETRTWFASVKGDISVAWRDLNELQQCQSSAPLARSTERCPFAAREAWSAADVDRYCRG
jgi:hypothetical protein